MRKKRVYLDTSVVSYLLQTGVEEKRKDTIKFWDILKSGVYEVYLSDVTLVEIGQCEEPKRSSLIDLLREIEYTEITVSGNGEIRVLANAIMEHRVLPPKSISDALHIAAALYRECDIVVSWNFKHLVNVRTIEGVRVVSLLNNRRSVDIYSPTMLLEDKDYEE